METETNSTSGHPEGQGSAAEGNQTKTESEKPSGEKSDDKVSYDSYRKLLGEKKKRDRELEDLRTELESLKTSKDSEDPDKKDQIKDLRQRLADSDQQYKKMIATFARRSVHSQVRERASKEGCVDADALIKLMDVNDLTIGDDFSVDTTELDIMLKDAKDRYRYLFKRDPGQVKDMPLKNGAPERQKDLKQMTKEELRELMLHVEKKGG